jgi:sugar phosphate isomerase/epimerase
MPIQSIPKREFNSLSPARIPMVASMIEEVEWFADDAKIVIGVLARDRSDDDFSIVVLGRDERRQFRAIDTDVSIGTVYDARAQLIQKMEKAAGDRRQDLSAGRLILGSESKRSWTKPKYAAHSPIT